MPKHVVRGAGPFWALTSAVTARVIQRGFVLDAGAALAVGIFCWCCGLTGVYLLDTGINYHQGWLIYRGYRPYHDFTGPLTPGAGLLTALGYLLFGVSYRSSVAMAAIIAGTSALLCVWLLHSVVGRPLARLFGAALTALALPLIGTLYYNHLLLDLCLVAMTAMLAHAVHATPEHESPPRRYAALAHALAALATLTKLHVGLSFWLVLTAVDLSCWRVYWRKPPRELLRQFSARAAFPVMLALAFLLLIRGDLSQFVAQTFQTADARLKLTKFVQYFGVKPSFVVAGQPLLGPLIFAAALLAQASLAWSELKAERGAVGAPVITQRLALIVRITGLGIGGLAAQVVFWLTSGDVPSAGTSTLGFTLVCLLAIASQQSFEPKGAARALRGAAVAAVPLLFGLLWFGVPYATSGARRSYSERRRAFIEADELYRFTGQTKLAFFTGVDDTFDHVYAYDFVAELRARNPGAKLFFGPSLEMLYAATDQLPPRNWPLWFHWGVSVREDAKPRLVTEFRRARPDVLIVTRDHQEAFLQVVIDAEYQPYLDPQLELTTLLVYRRKGFEL